MPLCFCFNSLSPSIFFSTSHLRSFCLSFFLLASLFTFINFLATTTSINKLTTTEHTRETVSTTTLLLPLLLLSSEDFRHHRFNCEGRIDRLRLQRKKHNSDKNQRTNASTTVELHQPNKTSVERTFIPYDYDLWQSAPIMPRMVTKCEHNLMMLLLKRFDQLAAKYSLEYMMIDGTLLGKAFLSMFFI